MKMLLFAMTCQAPSARRNILFQFTVVFFFQFELPFFLVSPLAVWPGLVPKKGTHSLTLSLLVYELGDLV